MSPKEVEPQLRRVLRDTRKLYLESARWLVSRHGPLLGGRADGFVELMDDLHRGLLIKIYTEVIRGDQRWTRMEKFVGSLLIEHLWDERLRGAALREAAEQVLQQADTLTWPQLVGSFVEYQPLADRIGRLETLVMRLANLVAKCDGLTSPEENQVLHELQDGLSLALGLNGPRNGSVAAHERLPGENLPSRAGRGNASEPKDRAQQHQFAPDKRPSGKRHSSHAAPELAAERPREEQLAEARAELDRLIGLGMIKERVRSLTNFLRLQRRREEAGMPTMPISLHMAFVGNPGTGKTTVARIVGQILGGMGIISRGHLVETDRTGLVAEYAGQTTTKTNELIDSALDGVLFIDEAYSLIASQGDDQYGREAIQVLLKRMEDDRDRLVVILAGYPDEMDEMIRSNPGLSSRINTRLQFDDYAPIDMGRIFDLLCQSNEFELPAASRHRLLLGLDALHRKRDRHFGNGRLVRNAFEDSVRRLADRVADIPELTPELLSVLEPADIALPGLSHAALDRLLTSPHVLRVRCASCQKRLRLEGRLLGARLRCPACEEIFTASWAEVDRDEND